MSLAKITTELTYKVPAWAHCNCQGNIFGQPSKDMCRFCVKEKGYYRCALYNEVLDTSQGTLVNKTRGCQKATARYASIIEDEETIPVDTNTVMKTAIQEYRKAYKQLIAQGFTDTIADKLAQQYLIGGK